MTETVEIEIQFNAPREKVFESLTDFNSLDGYTEAVRVAARGSGSGARIYFNFKKRVLEIPAEYTARLQIEEYTEPKIVTWKVTKDLDLSGQIELEETDGVTKVHMRFKFNPQNSELDALPAPVNATLSDIIDFILPVFKSEGSDILRKLTEDIEGKPRTPEVRVTHSTVDEIEETK